MNNVTTTGMFDWSSFVRVPATNEIVKEYELEAGDILFNNTNSAELVGKSALFEGHSEPVVFSNHFTRIRVAKELDQRFFALWLRSQWQSRVFENICNKWIGQAAVQRDKLLALEICFPPLSEQKRIATSLKEQLDAVDRAWKAAEEQLAAAKCLPAEYLREVFNSEQPKEWAVTTLADICYDISDGTHFTPTYTATGVPFLSVKDIRQTGISFESCRFISEEQHRELCRRCKPERGDVLYTKVGTTGIAKAIDIDEEFSIFVSVALLKLKPEISALYLEQVLNSPLGKKQAEKLTQGMANRNLVLRDIARIQVPVPPLHIQQGIVKEVATRTGSFEMIITECDQQLRAIARLPAQLLRQFFNSERLRLRA
jgi:type I restriction enzyme S subunit